MPRGKRPATALPNRPISPKLTGMSEDDTSGASLDDKTGGCAGMRPAIAYKILTGPQFDALRAGEFAGAPVDQADGYIHLSTAAQVTETVAKHFAGQTGLIIAAIPLPPLGDLIRWEISRNGALFPHFYGELRWAHVVAHGPLQLAADGTVALPEAAGL